MPRSNDEKLVWMENLSDVASNFRSPEFPPYKWEAHGYVGSVIQVPEKVANHNYLQKAEHRGKVRTLSEKEAKERMSDLRMRDEEVDDVSRLLDAMSLGASERSSRYAKDNLPDDAREMGEIRPEQNFNREGRTVRRSGAVSSQSEGIEGPLPTDAVLTQPQKEGDWSSDTG